MSEFKTGEVVKESAIFAIKTVYWYFLSTLVFGVFLISEFLGMFSKSHKGSLEPASKNLILIYILSTAVGYILKRLIKKYNLTPSQPASPDLVFMLVPFLSLIFYAKFFKAVNAFMANIF